MPDAYAPSVTDDPVIAALECCPLPDGVTSLDAPSLARFVRGRLSTVDTPTQAARILEQLTDGTATFSLTDMIGDYIMLVINSDTHGSHEYCQIHRSYIDDYGRLT
jgi:hypothetical protein